MSTKQTERDMVRDMAQRWLGKADAGAIDPDAEQCAMSRQYLRALEKIERMDTLLRDSCSLGSSTPKQVLVELRDVWPKVLT